MAAAFAFSLRINGGSQENLGLLRDEARDLGGALMLVPLTSNNDHLSRGFSNFIAGLLLFIISFVVDRYPRPATVLLIVVKIFISGGLPFFTEINRVAQENHDLERLREDLHDLGSALLLSQLTSNNHDVLRGIKNIISGLFLICISFAVDKFPLTAAMMLELAKNRIAAIV